MYSFLLKLIYNPSFSFRPEPISAGIRRLTEPVSPAPDVLTVLLIPYFMAASCFLFFSASFDAVSSAGAGDVGVGDGGGADTAAGAGAGLGDPPPPKHMGYLAF
jgi:hypothetical protein